MQLRPVHSTWPAAPAWRIQLSNTAKQFLKLQTERLCQDRKRPQTYLFASELQIRDVVLIDPRLLRQIELTPSALLSKFAKALPEQNTDVACHPHHSRGILGGAS